MWTEFTSKYGLACKQTGKLMVANHAAESRILEKYLLQAEANGVPGVRKISADEVRELESNVCEHSALLILTSGIVDPTALLRQVYASASNRGANFMSETEVVDLKLSNEAVIADIRYCDGQIP